MDLAIQVSWNVCLGLFFGHALSLGGEVKTVKAAVIAGFLLMAVLNFCGIY